MAHIDATTDAAPVLEGILTQMAVQADAGIGVLHAGLVMAGKTLILLPGERGSGKSTFSLHLARQGLAYGGDDLVFIDLGHDAVHPFPKSVTLKQGSFALCPDAPTFRDPVRGPVRYVLPEFRPPAEVALNDIRHIFFPSFTPGIQTHRTELTPEMTALALVQQLHNGLTGNPKKFELIKRLAARPAWILSYGDMEAASQEIFAVMAERDRS